MSTKAKKTAHYNVNSCSRVRAADFLTPWLKDRAKEMNLTIRMHRKLWELSVIAEVYRERMGVGILANHTEKGGPVYRSPRVLGFGVGREPLPAWFAAHNAEVLATDKPLDQSIPGWTETGQHAADKSFLPWEGICTEEEFDSVSFLPVDMNAFPSDIVNGDFDFTYSCGSFEHIGGIEASLNFFLSQMRCLRPGGIACHTTEYNFADDVNTIEAPDLVLFRMQDLERLRESLEAQGDKLLSFDFAPGTLPEDSLIDVHPYKSDVHLSLRIGEHVSTSIVLIAVRGGNG